MAQHFIRWLTAAVVAVAACATPTDPVPPNQPQARAGHVLVYNADQQSIVMFGGFAGDTFHSDVWRLSQGRWTRLAKDAPFAARTWQTVVFDPVRQNYVLFGGKTADRVPFGDTWLWDGYEWAEYKGAAPPARSHHTAVYDERRDVIVVFGGEANGRLMNDTWEWNGDEWRKIDVVGPPPRAAHMSAYDPLRRIVIVAGGVHPDNKTRLQDTWAWNGRTWIRLPDLPQPKALGSAVGTKGGVVVFGGWSEGFVPRQDTWQLTLDGWQPVPGVGPSARSGAALVFLPDRQAMILSGGLNDRFEAMNDAWYHQDDDGWQTKPAMFLR